MSPFHIPCRLVKPLLRYGHFLIIQDGGCLKPWIIKFRNLTAGMVRRTNMPHYAKFHANRSNSCRDMVVFRFSKTAPVWITHEEYLMVFVLVQNLVEINALISIICKFNILSIRLKNAYSCTFWG